MWGIFFLVFWHKYHLNLDRIYWLNPCSCCHNPELDASKSRQESPLKYILSTLSIIQYVKPRVFPLKQNWIGCMGQKTHSFAIHMIWHFAISQSASGQWKESVSPIKLHMPSWNKMVISWAGKRIFTVGRPCAGLSRPALWSFICQAIYSCFENTTRSIFHWIVSRHYTVADRHVCSRLTGSDIFTISHFKLKKIFHFVLLMLHITYIPVILSH